MCMELLSERDVDYSFLYRAFFTGNFENAISSFLALQGFIKNVLRLIEKLAKAKVRAVLLELARRTEAVKALHKPLLIIPHSLRPDEAAV